MDEFDAKEFAGWAHAAGLVTRNAVWTRLQSGHTNRVWKAESGKAAPVVIKQFVSSHATALFPNDADAEWRALQYLSETGLAPRPIARRSGPWGAVLSYEFARAVRSVGAEEHGAALARLHGVAAASWLRHLVLDSRALMSEARCLADKSPPELRAKLAATRPDSPQGDDTIVSTFLHGDPTPSNIVGTDAGPVLIDWQCPAAGDPIFDIACALSPSMHVNCGGRALTETEVDAFFDAYGDGRTAERFRRWRELLLWRLACHAAWRVATCGELYLPGFEADIALLERLQQKRA